jgi:hypothetical protein
MGVVDEKRKNEGRIQRERRIHFRAKVVIIHKDTRERTDGEAYDLSAGGMFIKTLLPYRPGTVVDVEVSMKPLNYRGSARVVRSPGSDEAEDRPYGMAVVWINPTANQQRLLFLQIDDHVRGGGKLLEGNPYEVSEPQRVARGSAQPASAATANRNLLIGGLVVAAVVVLVVLLVFL